MRINFTRDTDNERYVDGFTITFKDGRVLDMFVSFRLLKHVKTLFRFLTDDKDWMLRLWIFNVQYTDKNSLVWDEILEGLD
jgi:hypothetical protein